MEASLLTFRRPECTVGGENSQEVIVHVPEVREPLPLTIHHLPVTVTFAFFGEGNIMLNAQAAAAAAVECKKPVALAADGAVRKARVRETKPKAVDKPKHEIVIEINPDTDEAMKERSASMKNRKKKVDTMSSVLIARSCLWDY